MGSVKKTETGSVLNFNTYLPKNLDETKVSFTPKQSGSGTPSPENVREIVGKNGITVWQSNDDRARPLPKEYQQVEYIGTTGTQWLDTGVVPTVNTKSQIKMLAREMSGYVFYGLFTGNDATDYRLFMNNTRMYWDMPGGRIMTLVNTATTGTIYELELGNRYIKDLPTGTYPASNTRLDFELTNTITLNSYNGTQFSKSNWYYVKIYEADTLIRDFVPCYRKSDSVAGMYDLVSGTFYTNSGTGEFLVGEDIVGVETSVSFPAVGKNLFDGEWRKGRYVDGEWTATNTWRTSELIPVEPNTTYCVSVNEPRTIGKIYCNLFDRNGNWIGSDYGTSITTTADTALMTICNTNNVVSAWTDIQLEKGSTATDYEPFDNTIYGGYVDLVNGEVVAEWTKVDMGERNWAVAWNTFNTAPSNAANNGAGNTPTNIMCDIYPSDINTYATGVGVINKNIRGRANYKHICIRDDDYATAEDFKTAVTGHYLAYKLAEPIHYLLSPRILTTLKGNNVMWSDGDSLAISYTDDVVNTYDFRRHISLDTPHKASASGAVASFGTDMVGKMKCKIHFSPEQEGSGTPSPDNVRNIVGRDSVKLWQSSGNLLDVNTVTFTSQKYIKTDGSIATSSYYKISNVLPCSYLAGKTLTANTVIQTGGASVKSLGFYSSDDITSDSCVLAVHKANSGDKYATFTVPNTAKFMVFCMNTSRTLDGRYIIEGTEPLDDSGEIGAPNEITFTFPSTVGDNGVVYGGYLDAENGEVVEEYVYRDMTTFSSIKAPSGTSEPWNHRFALQHWANNTVGYDRVAGAQVMCDCIDTANGSGKTNYTGDASTAVWYVYDDAISTVAEFKEKYAGHYVAYRRKVALHEHYSLTPQSIATLRGSNRIWSDGDSVEVEYYKHTDEAQEYIPAEVLGTGNIAIVTSDGYLIGEEQDFIKY